MKNSILYLDSSRSRSITKALLGHGDVVYAADVNEALKEVVEHEFDYFFVDADTQHARAFLEHLSHDPQLPPPSGCILLTGNDEEDCEAWHVDTFVKRNRVKEDIPYIFSHLRRPPGEEARVLRIAPEPDCSEDREEAPVNGGIHVGLDEGLPAEGSDPRSRIDEPERGAIPSDRVPPPSPRRSAGTLPGRYRLAALILAVAAVGLWVFTTGPLSQSRAQKEDRKVMRKVEAEAPEAENVKVPKASDLSPVVPGDTALSSEVSQQVTAPAQVTESIDQSISPNDQVPGENKDVSSEAAPAPAANRQPGVSISGPAQVVARQVATFSAIASDPDGDTLTYSWGGNTTTRCWSAPGLYSVSVTVTDGRGGSASATMSVRVI